jgi:hypothetical protein
MAGAEILRLGRKTQEGIDLSVREERGRCWRSAGDPVDVVDRVEPDISCHQGHILMRARSQKRYADALAL